MLKKYVIDEKKQAKKFFELNDVDTINDIFAKIPDRNNKTDTSPAIPIFTYVIRYLYFQNNKDYSIQKIMFKYACVLASLFIYDSKKIDTIYDISEENPFKYLLINGIDVYSLMNYQIDSNESIYKVFNSENQKYVKSLFLPKETKYNRAHSILLYTINYFNMQNKPEKELIKIDYLIAKQISDRTPFVNKFTFEINSDDLKYLIIDNLKPNANLLARLLNSHILYKDSRIKILPVSYYQAIDLLSTKASFTKIIIKNSLTKEYIDLDFSMLNNEKIYFTINDGKNSNNYEMTKNGVRISFAHEY